MTDKPSDEAKNLSPEERGRRMRAAADARKADKHNPPIPAWQPTPSLLPCPFCGGEAKVTGYRSCDCCGKAYNGSVTCQTAGCGAEVSHFDTDDEAIAAWNRRTLPEQPAEAWLEAMRGAADREDGMFRDIFNDDERADIMRAAYAALRAEMEKRDG